VSLVQPCSETPSFEHLENCLHLFNSFLLARCVQADTSVIAKNNTYEAGDHDLADGLVSLCLVAEAIASTAEFHAQQNIGDSRESPDSHTLYLLFL
jgi:hypothetical protein